jgi:hypothetical protein
VYTIRMGSDVAEAQIDDLSDAEVDVLLEIYEVLRLTPIQNEHGGAWKRAWRQPSSSPSPSTS